MNDPLYLQLRELAWRRKLTEAEEAHLRSYLAGHPEAETEWEAEAGLNHILEQLPEVPLASNFTARVVQAVEREVSGQSPRQAAWGKLRWLASGWLPKTAVAAAMLSVGLLGYHHHRVVVRLQMAQSLPKVTRLIALSSPDVWENFDAINKLSPTPTQPDRELLALMK